MFGSDRPKNRIEKRRRERQQRHSSQPEAPKKARRREFGLLEGVSGMRLEARPESRPLKPARPSKSPTARRRLEEERSMPPVMVRGGVQDLPLPGRRSIKTPKARRRFDVALSVPGAEMRLPALPQIHIGWRVVSAALLALLLAGIYTLWDSPSFRVQAVTVKGLQRLSSADVDAVLNLEDESIFALDAGQIQKKLQTAFPEFSKVSVDVALKNKVTVTIDERLPILTWHQGDRTILVDANGMSFPQRDQAPAGPALTVEAASAPAGEPAAEGDGTQVQFMPVDMVSAILSISAQAPQGATLVYDPQHGLGWKDPKGWEAYFGDVQEMGMKLSVYQTLLAKLKQEDVHPALVSVEHVHAPYYRLER